MSVLDVAFLRIPFLYFLGQFKMMKLNKLALWSIWSLNLKTAKFTEITNMSTELNFFILTSLITFNSHALSSYHNLFASYEDQKLRVVVYNTVNVNDVVKCTCKLLILS